MPLKFLPPVSVVFSTYNCTALLERAFAGLWHQDYTAKRIQVIVADDGSSDGLEAFLTSCNPPWPVRLITQKHQGFRLATARNEGIRAAAHNLIVQLDGDIIPSQSLVTAHVQALIDDMKSASVGLRRYVDLCAVCVEDIYRNPAILNHLPGVLSASNWFLSSDRRESELAAMSGHPAPYNIFHGCNVAFRRDGAVEAGLYDESFNGHWGYEDVEFAYRLWKHGTRIIPNPTALGYHQENAVVSFDDRVRGDAHNFEIACAKIPDFRRFKEKLINNGRTPWWTSG